MAGLCANEHIAGLLRDDRHGTEQVAPTAVMRLNQHDDPDFPVCDTAISVLSSEILKSYLGLPVQGKTDFDAIEAFRDERFFAEALGIRNVPSSPILRQRLEEKSESEQHTSQPLLLLKSRLI